MELKEKLNGGRSGPSCRATVGGFHSDSVFGGDPQISQVVNCLSVRPFWISMFCHSVQQRLFLYFDI